MKATWPYLALVTSILTLAVEPAAAEETEPGRFYGMLRERDLTPFGFLRLDMRPAGNQSKGRGCTFAAGRKIPWPGDIRSPAFRQ